MALTPFRGFWDTQSEFDRIFFDDVMRDVFGRAAGRGGAGTREQLWAPRLEAFAKDWDLVLHADLPGVSLEDVDITLDANVLTISGERKGTIQEGEGVSYYLNELLYGAFRRSVTVPEGGGRRVHQGALWERCPRGGLARGDDPAWAQEDSHRG
jgi:HSP20 family protein